MPPISDDGTVKRMKIRVPLPRKRRPDFSFDDKDEEVPRSKKVRLTLKLATHAGSAPVKRETHSTLASTNDEEEECVHTTNQTGDESLMKSQLQIIGAAILSPDVGLDYQTGMKNSSSLSKTPVENQRTSAVDEDDTGFSAPDNRLPDRVVGQLPKTQFQIVVDHLGLGGYRTLHSEILALDSITFIEDIVGSWNLSLLQIQQIDVIVFWDSFDDAPMQNLTSFSGRDDFSKIKTTVLWDLKSHQGIADMEVTVAIKLFPKHGVIENMLNGHLSAGAAN